MIRIENSGGTYRKSNENILQLLFPYNVRHIEFPAPGDVTHGCR